MIRDWFIHLLDGCTREEYEEVYNDYEKVYEEMVSRGKTIKELSALISAPKKPKGRPRKVSVEPVKAV
jgi:hypothetical protein